MLKHFQKEVWYICKHYMHHPSRQEQPNLTKNITPINHFARLHSLQIEDILTTMLVDTFQINRPRLAFVPIPSSAVNIEAS